MRLIRFVYKHIHHGFYLFVAVAFSFLLADRLEQIETSHEALLAIEYDLAKNIYREGRAEPPVAKAVIGMITLGRVYAPEYPDSVEAVVYQKNQFSWTREIELIIDEPTEGDPMWRQSRLIAGLLLRKPELFALPSKEWTCAHFYKRTDNRGVSKNSQRWFKKNLVKVGEFGAHSAYAPKGGCKVASVFVPQ